MTFTFRFKPLQENFPLNRIFELNNQIGKSMPFLEKNLDRLLSYLKKEADLKNYIEINLPFLDSNISYKLVLYGEKIIISVMSHDDSKIFGNLLIEGYDCLDKNGIKELGINLMMPKGKDRFKGIY